MFISYSIFRTEVNTIPISPLSLSIETNFNYCLLFSNKIVFIINLMSLNPLFNLLLDCLQDSRTRMDEMEQCSNVHQ